MNDSETLQMSILADRQAQLIDRLLQTTGTPRDTLAIKTFSSTPALAMQVDERELDVLLGDPEVEDVSEDMPVPSSGF